MSDRAPRDLFTRDRFFNSLNDKISHPLSAEQLMKLTRVHGYMPKVVLSRDAPSLEEIADRVAFLDEEARIRVQAIADRLTTRRVSSRRVLCRCLPLGGIGRYLRLGVIREIWHEIVFYIFYSFALQWYAHSCDWDFKWSAFNQDTIYYQALVMSFLLSFRASDCMLRYEAGCQHCFKMEKQLREMAFEVMTRLSLETGQDQDPESHLKSLKRRYFKHEFRRLAQVLLACAARDLNDSALDGEELAEEEAARLRCAMTEAEHASIHVTHSAHGHVFRVYLAASWLQKLVLEAQRAGLFDGDDVFEKADGMLRDFTAAWMSAKQIAYSSMPASITHLLWLLASMMNLVLPWEYVSICRWLTWIPSMIISISFFGIVRIASAMENPFGFDDDDIPMSTVAQHLDEEISLIMYYAALDEVGGENLFRGLLSQEYIHIKWAQHSDG